MLSLNTIDGNVLTSDRSIEIYRIDSLITAAVENLYFATQSNNFVPVRFGLGDVLKVITNAVHIDFLRIYRVILVF